MKTSGWKSSICNTYEIARIIYLDVESSVEFLENKNIWEPTWTRKSKNNLWIELHSFLFAEKRQKKGGKKYWYKSGFCFGESPLCYFDLFNKKWPKDI